MCPGGKKKRFNEKIQVYDNPGKAEEANNSKVTNGAIYGEQLFFSIDYSSMRMPALFLFPPCLVAISLEHHPTCYIMADSSLCSTDILLHSASLTGSNVSVSKWQNSLKRNWIGSVHFYRTGFRLPLSQVPILGPV